MGWKIGSRVEACSWEEGFGGAWCECKILDKIRDETGQVSAFKVQYEKFVVRDGGEPLVEVVPASQIRPIPPGCPLPEELCVGHKVEAYDSDCWWRGEIIKFWIGCSEPRFLVFFPDTATCSSYSRVQLRVRHEWIDGRWHRMFEETTNRQRITEGESGPSNALHAWPESGNSHQRNQRISRKSKRSRQPTTSSLEWENNTIEDEDYSLKRRKTNDWSALVRRYEVNAYRKVFRMFLRSGLDKGKLEVLRRTADALNIDSVDHMDIHKSLIRHQEK